MTSQRFPADLVVESYSGSEAEPFLPDVARLRIEVFREFPYLYDGHLEYEEKYLATYCRSPEAVIVVARQGQEIVGVSTALPLLEHSDEVGPVLAKAGFDPSRIYYFGESVLRRDARGLGIGHAFFDHREAAARRSGRFTHTSFCAVARPKDHPARPADYVPHDAFWKKRGYEKREDIVASFSWRDLGAAEETAKPMVFWVREL